MNVLNMIYKRIRDLDCQVYDVLTTRLDEKGIVFLLNHLRQELDFLKEELLPAFIIESSDYGRVKKEIELLKSKISALIKEELDKGRGREDKFMIL